MFKTVSIICLLFLLACSAEVSLEKAATAPLVIENTVVCADKPSSQKEGLCARAFPNNVVQGEFFVGALAQNVYCEDKLLVGNCDIVLTDSAGEVLYQTQVPLQSEIDSCLVPPKNRNFLCHVGLNANQLEPGDYTATFAFQDSSGSTAEENVGFSVE